MKKLTIALLLLSCNQHSYNTGRPIIIKKVQSLIPNISIYTYEGYGSQNWFEEKSNRYEIGDTLPN